MGHIDSIRGIAALLVLFQHVSSGFISIPTIEAQGTLLYDIAYSLSFGKTGVITFFAISGFVICPSLKGERAVGARRFLISRFFRLYPPFWTAILIVLVGSLLWQPRAIETAALENWSIIFGNASMLYSVFQVEPLEGLFWTLEVELVFYMLCLTLFLCGWLHRPIVLFIVGMAMMAIYQALADRPTAQTNISDMLNPHWAGMPWYLAIMFWGGLFRIWFDDNQRTCTVLGYQIPVIVLVVALLFVILLRPLILTDKYLYTGRGMFTHGFPYLLGLGLFIVGALYVKVNNAFFVWLGAISYSVYLLHPVAFYVVKSVIKTDPSRFGNMHVSVYLLICTVLTILLAGLVYRLVERPAVNLGRALQKR